MLKKISFWMVSAGFFVLQSCSLNSETNYFKDSATSMQTNILMDPSMLGMMNMMGNSVDTKEIAPGVDLNSLPTEWKSLYDVQKTGKIVLNEKDAGALKKNVSESK